MSDVFRKAYDDEELVQKLLSDELDWMTFNKNVPRSGLGFRCDLRGCGNEPSFRCTSCLTSWYCSRDCQKEDWASHRPKCKMYKDGRLKNEIYDPFDEGEYSYPPCLQPRDSELDWENQNDPINEECQICLEAKFDPKKSIVLPCRHQFCAGCIIDWQKGNLIDRGGHQQADQCPACRQRMPVIEQSLMKRADMLLREARDMRKNQGSNLSSKGGDKQLADEDAHNHLFREAVDLLDKAMLSKHRQRTTFIEKASIFIEMKRNVEAVQEIEKLMNYHYSVTTNPVALNCAKYEQALKEGNEEKMDELMDIMTQQLRGMHRAITAPFLMINDAYTMQVRAFMAEEDWTSAAFITEAKLLNFTWKLMADTPWISQGPLAGKVARRNLEYMLNLGICAYKTKKYESGIQPLYCAVMMNRQSKLVFDAYRYYALIFKELGDWEEVLKVITMAALYQPHCESLGKPTRLFFKEMLRDWHENHRHDDAPQLPKMDILLR